MRDRVKRDAATFLNALADLVEEYKADISYTTDDDGIHIELYGNKVFSGYLCFDDSAEKLRAAADKYCAIPRRQKAR